ncbi:hypothetical protein VPH35_014189 [Triticum aestivum]
MRVAPRHGALRFRAPAPSLAPARSPRRRSRPAVVGSASPGRLARAGSRLHATQPCPASSDFALTPAPAPAGLSWPRPRAGSSPASLQRRRLAPSPPLGRGFRPAPLRTSTSGRPRASAADSLLLPVAAALPLHPLAGSRPEPAPLRAPSRCMPAACARPLHPRAPPADLCRALRLRRLQVAGSPLRLRQHPARTSRPPLLAVVVFCEEKKTERRERKWPAPATRMAGSRPFPGRPAPTTRTGRVLTPATRLCKINKKMKSCVRLLKDDWQKKEKKSRLGQRKEKKNPSACFATRTVSRDPRCRLCQAGWTASYSDDPNLGGYTQRVR